MTWSFLIWILLLGAGCAALLAGLVLLVHLALPHPRRFGHFLEFDHDE